MEIIIMLTNLKKSKKKNIIIRILCILALLLIVGDWILSVVIYNENINNRFETYKPFMLYVDDFKGLKRTKYKFPSDKGQVWYYVNKKYKLNSDKLYYYIFL